MGNKFGSDILIQTEDPKEAAAFYTEQLGFEISDETSNLISLHGQHISLFIERGPALGPVLEVTVDGVEEAKARLMKQGCEIVKDEPNFPRCYVKDPFGLIYNLTNLKIRELPLNRIAKTRKADTGGKHIERVRRICLALPETMEKLSHGEPTFFVKKKVFAMCSINLHNDGHIAVVLPAPIGVQQALIEAAPKKYYKPPYVGGAGWVGVELPRVSDKDLKMHLHEAWRLIAPPRSQAKSQNRLR